jgi:hypothetical protein
MDNVQKTNSCINMPSSQTFRSYVDLRNEELRPIWVRDIFTQGEKTNFQVKLVQKYYSLL